MCIALPNAIAIGPILVSTPGHGEEYTQILLHRCMSSGLAQGQSWKVLRTTMSWAQQDRQETVDGWNNTNISWAPLKPCKHLGKHRALRSAIRVFSIFYHISWPSNVAAARGSKVTEFMPGCPETCCMYCGQYGKKTDARFDSHFIAVQD